MNASARPIAVVRATGAASLSRAPLWPAVALLAISGSASLMFQIVWIKQLSLIVGVEVHAIAAAVAAFFSGLGCGQLVAGPSGGPVRPAVSALRGHRSGHCRHGHNRDPRAGGRRAGICPDAGVQPLASLDRGHSGRGRRPVFHGRYIACPVARHGRGTHRSCRRHPIRRQHGRRHHRCAASVLSAYLRAGRAWHSLGGGKLEPGGGAGRVGAGSAEPVSGR